MTQILVVLGLLVFIVLALLLLYVLIDFLYNIFDDTKEAYAQGETLAFIMLIFGLVFWTMFIFAYLYVVYYFTSGIIKFF